MNIKALVCCGLFSAIIAITSWIAVPFAVPFTMQTFGIFCALLILGGKLGTISTAVYVLLGIAGLPVFAGFQGGIGIILSPLGGFIIGFIALGIVYFLITKLFGGNKLSVQIISLVTGLLVCYTTGILWYMHFADINDISAAFTTCILPFIFPDGIKLWLAVIVTKKIKQANTFADKKRT